jgi:sugar lactone lactonase YvrE
LGGVYVSDYDAHVVRYVDPAGTIETVAGTGNRGYSGDGGPGPDAQLFGPTRLRLDDQNRLLICDTDNHAIRRLDPNGAIHTIAGNGTPGYSGDGGPASDAVLDSPYDLRITTNGDLYFADAGNSVIRRIDVNGTMTTVVGNGVSAYDGDGEDFRGCSLNRPSGIHFAPDGTLWIADAYNHRVRKISAFLSEVD